VNVYHETTWDKVKAGDTVLLAYPFDKIIRVQITDCVKAIGIDDEPTVQAEFVHDRVTSRTTAATHETVYIKSRF